MKYWDSVRKQTDYYDQHYGHIFHPVASFDELLSMFEKVGKINPEDAFETLNTWKLLEDYENKFIFSCKPRNEGMLISHIIMKYVAGKVLRERCDDRHAVYEIPKAKTPKEKIEVVETPEVKAEEMNIFISDIFIPPDYLRRKVKPNRVNEIAKSMKEIGQVDPIFVVPIEYVKDIEKKYGAEIKKKYKYILIRGRHRIEAKKLLNNFYIRARVIYNDYEKERLRSFVENTLHNEASVYEQSLEINRFLNLGMSEREIAKEIGKPQPYVNRIKKYAELKDKFGEKDYVLTILTEGALEQIYLISIDPDPRQLNFMKEKLIKAYESGVEKVDVNDIYKWSDEYAEPIRKKEEEIKRKLYGEEITIQKPIESQQVQQVQLQVEKPISRIPTQEEVKEKAKEVRRKKEKTPEEKFNHGLQHAGYFINKEKANIINGIINEIPIEDRIKLNIPETFRKIDDAIWNIIKQSISLEKLKGIIRDVIMKQLKK
jgi:ParB/RepB/Spo0J family partition protein